MLHAAIDLGATSGRIIIGGDASPLLELYRFETPVLRLASGIYWDFEKIFSHILTGLRLIDRKKYPVCSVSCDSWAQDFGLVDASGGLTAPPFSYHDKGAAVSSLARLEYIERNFPERLEKAKYLLHIADLVHFRLCGQARGNRTLTGISGLPADHPLLAPAADCEIIGRIGCPELPNLAGLPVISGAGHDTAAAYAGSGVREGEILFSLGTWLMAAEPWPEERESSVDFRRLPLVRGAFARTAGSMGLWPFQECVKIWKKRGCFPGYAALDDAAEKSGVTDAVDPAAPELFSPENMENAIFAMTGSTWSPAGITALLLRGVARRIRRTAEVFGHDFSRAVLVGGGAKSAFLCRLIAEELACPLAVGEAEAAAAGNIEIQHQVLKEMPCGQ